MLDKERVGKTISLYRKRLGLTQKELADKLHISYQAVSKWEAGVSLPTVEMLYEIATVMSVTVDALLNEGVVDNRWITYMDTGLDTIKLYSLKDEVQKLASEDDNLISANYADAALFKIDTTGMKEPVYAMLNCVPGSKEGYARKHGYDREICADVAANAINHVLQHGMKPVILQGMIMCGNNASDQLYRMARTFREVCIQNNVMFAGMEIAAQPVNYRPDEYRVTANIVGVQDREKMISLKMAREGDVLIGLKTEGINGTNYPIIKVMLDRRPELAYAKIDGEHHFMEEIMKANVAYGKEIAALQEAECLHGIIRVKNQLMNTDSYSLLPEGLGACMQLSQIPIFPLYSFLMKQDMIGKNVFHYHFHFGIGMVVVVPKEKLQQALEIIGKYRECYCIGSIEKNREHKGKKVWAEGEIKW